MTDTERLDWLAQMMALSTGDDPDKAEAADAVGQTFNKAFNDAIEREIPEVAFRMAIDAARIDL